MAAISKLTLFILSYWAGIPMDVVLVASNWSSFSEWSRHTNEDEYATQRQRIEGTVPVWCGFWSQAPLAEISYLCFIMSYSHRLPLKQPPHRVPRRYSMDTVPSTPRIMPTRRNTVLPLIEAPLLTNTPDPSFTPPYLIRFSGHHEAISPSMISLSS